MKWNLIVVLVILGSFSVAGIYEGYHEDKALPSFFAAVAILALCGYGLGYGVKIITTLWW